MNCNTKTITLVVLIILILVVSVSLIKMTIHEKFQGNPYSIPEVVKLIEGVTKLDGKDTNVSNLNRENTQSLDYIEKLLQMIYKNETSSAVTAAEEAKKKEYLILKCSPNSEVANFENAPDVQSQADSNRQILQEIYNELDGLSQ